MNLATNSHTEWTETTWNPVTGCTKISAGCKNCYAERMAKRLQAMGMERYKNGFDVTLHEDLVELPLRWRQPRLILVNSMSDLFHQDVPFAFIERVFGVMTAGRQHPFQILTKRGERLAELASELPWPENVWTGVSLEICENSRSGSRSSTNTGEGSISIGRTPTWADRFNPIRRDPLGDSGGESGAKARPMRQEWVESILQQCRKDVPFFFKQWGGTRKNRTGRVLHGKTYDEMPATQIFPLAALA